MIEIEMKDLGKRKLGREITNGFFDRKAVADLIGSKEAGAQSKQGALVRRIARRSLRVGRRLRFTELNEEDQRAHQIKTAIWAKNGWGKPKIWQRVFSKPGQPPKLWNDSSPLKQLLVFAFDSSTRRTLVGPARYPRSPVNVPRMLEHGGGGTTRWGKPYQIAKRPFMLPALMIAKNKFAEFFKG